MATSQEIKGFIAQWLQLGKSIEHIDGVRCFKPSRILGYQGYSQEFENWWQEFEANAEQWALSGTHQPLSVLFGALWEISSCARCEMPVPLQASAASDVFCPCHDLPTWPNSELPQPRLPQDSESRLDRIYAKLNQ